MRPLVCRFYLTTHSATAFRLCGAARSRHLPLAVRAFQGAIRAVTGRKLHWPAATHALSMRRAAPSCDRVRRRGARAPRLFAAVACRSSATNRLARRRWRRVECLRRPWLRFSADAAFPLFCRDRAGSARPAASRDLCFAASPPFLALRTGEPVHRSRSSSDVRSDVARDVRAFPCRYACRDPCWRPCPFMFHPRAPACRSRMGAWCHDAGAHGRAARESRRIACRPRENTST